MNPQITQTTQIPEGRDPRTHAIIGAAMEVHRRLGCGFLEAMYQEALAVEMSVHGIPFEREVELPVYYRGGKLSVAYRADFVCFGSVVVELKALGKFGGVEESQLINYLKSSGLEVGLLLNFGAKSLEYHRAVCSPCLHSAKSAESADEEGR
jgi:GxxExxY protein